VAWSASRVPAIPWPTQTPLWRRCAWCARTTPTCCFAWPATVLALAEHAAELQSLRLSHLTITINTLDPATGARIYAWVRDGDVCSVGRPRGTTVAEAAAALEALRGTGILIK